jgi:hypothetical protein
MIISVEKIYVDENFSRFKITTDTNEILFVPNQPANRHYQAIQEWAAIEGNNIIDPGA